MCAWLFFGGGERNRCVLRWGNMLRQIRHGTRSFGSEVGGLFLVGTFYAAWGCEYGRVVVRLSFRRYLIGAVAIKAFKDGENLFS